MWKSCNPEYWMPACIRSFEGYHHDWRSEIQRPGCGLERLFALKDADATRGIPVVLITGRISRLRGEGKKLVFFP